MSVATLLLQPSRPPPFVRVCNALRQDATVDRSNDMLKNTVSKIGNLLQSGGGVRHMIALIGFVFVVVRRLQRLRKLTAATCSS